LSFKKTGKDLVALQTYVNAKRTDFLFTHLNEIKPDMIAEATRNAREAAEQFARDSGSRVEKIRTAKQGLFSIDVSYWNAPENKVVRVVTPPELRSSGWLPAINKSPLKGWKQILCSQYPTTSFVPQL
jgi:hypothetical protein